MYMLGGKPFLGLVLLALIFVVSCSALPVEPETDLSGLRIYANMTRKETRSMFCKDIKTHVVVCKDLANNMVNPNQYPAINDHLLYDSPSTGSYKSYSVCNVADSCVSMKTLTGSTFAPYNYRHVTEKALAIFKGNNRCMVVPPGEKLMCKTAFDVYLYEYNFVYSWWFESSPPIYGHCAVYETG